MHRKVWLAPASLTGLEPISPSSSSPGSSSATWRRFPRSSGRIRAKRAPVALESWTGAVPAKPVSQGANIGGEPCVDIELRLKTDDRASEAGPDMCERARARCLRGGLGTTEEETDGGGYNRQPVDSAWELRRLRRPGERGAEGEPTWAG
eukprot:scaffold6420_cov93-Isochrysis_galbana.AAC.2